MRLEVNNRVFYLDFIHNQEILKRGTTAVLFNHESVELSRGFARCHSADVFNKKIGRKLALARCLDKTAVTKEFRALFWEVYFKTVKP
jgi:hypothetical protein